MVFGMPFGWFFLVVGSIEDHPKPKTCQNCPNNQPHHQNPPVVGCCWVFLGGVGDGSGWRQDLENLRIRRKQPNPRARARRRGAICKSLSHEC